MPEMWGMQELLIKAREDKEEWVKFMIRGIGDFSGQLDMDAVIAGSVLVEAGLQDLEAELPDEEDNEFRPLEVGPALNVIQSCFHCSYYDVPVFVRWLHVVECGTMWYCRMVLCRMVHYGIYTLFVLLRTAFKHFVRMFCTQ